MGCYYCDGKTKKDWSNGTMRVTRGSHSVEQTELHAPFIFIHIPKCAGTSISQALENQVCKNSVCGNLRGGATYKKHWWLSHYLWEFDPRKLENIVASVRNPFDRVVSYWCWKFRGKEGTEDFNEWVYEWYYKKRYLSIWAGREEDQFINGIPFPYAPCTWFLTMPGSKEIAANHILRYENLKSDWKDLLYKLNIKEEITLGHANASRGNPSPNVPPWDLTKEEKPYQEWYNERSIDIISNEFKIDLDTFGYKFDKIK